MRRARRLIPRRNHRGPQPLNLVEGRDTTPARKFESLGFQVSPGILIPPVSFDI